MIYTVECAFTDPAREDSWNEFYSGDKLTTLLSFPGFRASQRFRAIMDIPAPYLAIHSIRDAAVLEQTVYRDGGGGTFSGWDDLVTNWDRNLFTGMEAAPEVPTKECLVILDDPAQAHKAPDADFTWLDIAGLDRTTDRRGLAIVDRGTGERLACDKGKTLRVFAPISPRRVSPHGIDS
jgi:hypothetical protein